MSKKDAEWYKITFTTLLTKAEYEDYLLMIELEQT